MFGVMEYNATAIANPDTYNQTYYSVVNTMNLGSFYVFIHVYNEYNSYVYSDNITVIIDFPCVNDTFWVNVTKPEFSLTEKYTKTAEGFYVLTFEEETDTLKEWSANITSRIESLSPEGYCNITNYRIDKVLDSSNNLISNSTWQKLFYVSSDGGFYVTKFNKAYDNYRVFISPFNGEIWGDFLD